jgi:hypothetical protein
MKTSKGVNYSLDKRDEIWYTFDNNNCALKSPQYQLQWSQCDIHNSILQQFDKSKPCKIAYCLLPFCTRPAWPKELTTPLHLVYWLCADCGDPLIDGIGRIAIIFGLGYDLVSPKAGIVWTITLVGPCCLKENDLIVGTSYTDNVLEVYNALEPIITKAMFNIKWPCVGCGELKISVSKQRRLCGNKDCESIFKLINVMKKSKRQWTFDGDCNDIDIYDPIKERLELFVDLLYEMELDLVTPIRFARCHNLSCFNDLPESHKDGGFLCCSDCRRVIYCSRKCRQTLLGAHRTVGCESYKNVLKSERLIFLKWKK